MSALRAGKLPARSATCLRSHGIDAAIREPGHSVDPIPAMSHDVVELERRRIGRDELVASERIDLVALRFPGSEMYEALDSSTRW